MIHYKCSMISHIGRMVVGVLLFLFALQFPSAFSAPDSSSIGQIFPYTIDKEQVENRIDLFDYFDINDILWKQSDRYVQFLLSSSQREEMKELFPDLYVRPAKIGVSSYQVSRSRKNRLMTNGYGVDLETIADADHMDLYEVDGAGMKIGIIADGITDDSRPLFAGKKSFRLDGSKTSGEGGTVVQTIMDQFVSNVTYYFAAVQTVDDLIDAFNYFRTSEPVDLVINTVTFPGLGPYYDEDTDNYRVKQAMGDLLVVQAAGDFGQTHIYAEFTEQPLLNQHNFEGDSGGQLVFTLPAGESVQIVVYWDDAWGEANSNFDIYVTDSSWNIVDYSYGSQGNGSGSPYESLIVNNTSGASKIFYFNLIESNSSSKRGIFFHLFLIPLNTSIPVSENSILRSPLDYFTEERHDQFTQRSSLPGVADISTMLTVGSINPYNKIIRDYSSQGASTVTLMNPDLVAMDGVNVGSYTDARGTAVAAAFVGIAAVSVKSQYMTDTAWNIMTRITDAAQELPEGDTQDKKVYGEGLLKMRSIELPEQPTALPTKTPTPTHTPTATLTPIPTNTFPPTPTTTPPVVYVPSDTMIVTDDIHSTEDLIGSYDIDQSDEKALVIRFNFPEGTYDKFHLLASIDGGGPEWIGIRNSDQEIFVWSENQDSSAGYNMSEKKSPEYGHSYKFHVYAKYLGEEKGEISASDVVYYPGPDKPIPVNVPEGEIYVTDDIDSTENLIGKTDYDKANDLGLTIRWNGMNAGYEFYAIYASDDNGASWKYVNNAKPGSDFLSGYGDVYGYHWDPSKGRDISIGFNKSYLFKIWGMPDVVLILQTFDPVTIKEGDGSTPEPTPPNTTVTPPTEPPTHTPTDTPTPNSGNNPTPTPPQTSGGSCEKIARINVGSGNAAGYLKDQLTLPVFIDLNGDESAITGEVEFNLFFDQNGVVTLNNIGEKSGQITSISNKNIMPVKVKINNVDFSTDGYFLELIFDKSPSVDSGSFNVFISNFKTNSYSENSFDISPGLGTFLP